MGDYLAGFRVNIRTLVFLCVLLCWRLVFAQPSKGESEYLVPPQGGAVEVPVHAGAACILSFPEKLGPEALVSSSDLEIKAWGNDGIAIRAAHANVPAANLALATAAATSTSPAASPARSPPASRRSRSTSACRAACRSRCTRRS
jgi:hypothetical protein